MLDDKSIKHEESYFMNSDRLSLFEQIWSVGNIDETRALVFVIHGLSEHSSFCYEDSIVKPLVKIGCMVVSHDHMGHGRSEGNRKIVGDIGNLARDVREHIMDIRTRKSIPDATPTFLYGHSLGGLIACILSLEIPHMISGMVLEGPALCLKDKAGSSLLAFPMARMISLIMPGFVLNKPVFANLSRNPSIVQAASEDKHRNIDGLTLGTAVNISNAILSLKSRLKDIKTPFFVAHGEKDAIVSVVASRTLVKEASTQDKSFYVYPNALHLLRGECDDVGEDFSRRTVQWIDGRIR